MFFLHLPGTVLGSGRKEMRRTDDVPKELTPNTLTSFLTGLATSSSQPLSTQVISHCETGHWANKSLHQITVYYQESKKYAF